MAKEKRELLYNDQITFNYFDKISDDALAIFEDIKKVVYQAIGDAPIDYTKLFLDSDVLADTYIKTYRKTKPKHLDSKVVFKADTNVDLAQLNVLLVSFTNTNNKLSQYKYTITPSDLKSNLNIEMFNRYLKPELKEKFEALAVFVGSVNNLKKYYDVPIYNAQKCSEDLKLDGLVLKIELQKFI